MPEDLTIVFANLGQWENLNACLTSLYETTSGKYSLRVIVGFNFHGSSDTPQRLAAAFPRVELLRAPAKLGYCRAYNLLMAESNSRYVVLLDDDTILRRGTIDGMVAFMDEHPEVGIASCRTVNPDGTYQKTTARMYDLASEIANVFYPAVFWQDGIDGTLAEWRQAGWLNSHFLIVRSEIIDTVGVLDEYYYTFQCEADWCLRIRRRGWKIAYLPGLRSCISAGPIA